MNLLYSVLLLIGLSSINCKYTKNAAFPNKNNFVAIELNAHIEKKSKENSAIILASRLQMMFYSKFIIIKEFYESYTAIKNSFSGDTLLTELGQPLEKYFYLLYDSTNQFCYRVDSLDINTTFIPLKLDSVLKQKLPFQFSNMYNSIKNTVVEISNVQLSDTTKVYFNARKNKPDPSFSDSVYYYYSTSDHVKKIPFSFAQELDSLKTRKLFKIRILYNENKNGRTEYEKIAKELLFEMKPIKLLEEMQVKKLLDSFNVRYSNNLLK